jgi:hypothetical protein
MTTNPAQQQPLKLSFEHVTVIPTISDVDFPEVAHLLSCADPEVMLKDPAKTMQILAAYMNTHGATAWSAVNALTAPNLLHIESTAAKLVVAGQGAALLDLLDADLNFSRPMAALVFLSRGVLYQLANNGHTDKTIQFLEKIGASHLTGLDTCGAGIEALRTRCVSAETLERLTRITTAIESGQRQRRLELGGEG